MERFSNHRQVFRLTWQQFSACCQSWLRGTCKKGADRVWNCYALVTIICSFQSNKPNRTFSSDSYSSVENVSVSGCVHSASRFEQRRNQKTALYHCIVPWLSKQPPTKYRLAAPCIVPTPSTADSDGRLCFSRAGWIHFVLSPITLLSLLLFSQVLDLLKTKANTFYLCVYCTFGTVCEEVSFFFFHIVAMVTVKLSFGHHSPS